MDEVFVLVVDGYDQWYSGIFATEAAALDSLKARYTDRPFIAWEEERKEYDDLSGLRPCLKVAVVFSPGNFDAWEIIREPVHAGVLVLED